MNDLQLKMWALHFEGKKINGHEYEVVILQSELREVKLGALCLDNGKGNKIAHGIGGLIDEFNFLEQHQSSGMGHNECKYRQNKRGRCITAEEVRR